MKTFIFLFLFSLSLSAQSKIGLEIRGSGNMTFNTGNLISGAYNNGHGADLYVVLDERNRVSPSYAIGLVFSFTPHIQLKFHFGQHSNGTTLDMEVSTYYFSGVLQRSLDYFRYRQYNPSFSYILLFDEHKFPINLGASINQTVDRSALLGFFTEIWNYDIRTSVGYEYEFFKNVNVGLNFVYSFAPVPYEMFGYVEGDFIPHQVGLELAVRYDFISWGD